MRSFEVNVSGRLKKYNIKTEYDPLFEAVSNSIQAIEDLKGSASKGQIVISLNRESTQTSLDFDDDKVQPITDIKIEDDGIGFDENNFKSFITIDSSYKADRGGQGIGRLAWLKVFESVSIESTYKSPEDGLFYTRPFQFMEKGVEESDLRESSNNESKTTVHLSNLRKASEEKYKKKIDYFTDKILHHFLSLFATGNIPQITLKDISTNESVNINLQYNNQIAKDQISRKFSILGNEFKITGLLVTNDRHAHKMSLCAHKRTVCDTQLEKSFPLLKKGIKNSEGKSVKLFAFIESDYLDNNVNETRSHFNFPEEEDDQGQIFTPIDLKSIFNSAAESISSDVNTYLEEVKKENSEQVTSYINNKSPRYKFLVKHKKDDLDNIVFSSEKDLDSKLRKIEFEVEQESREAANDLLEGKVQDIQDEEEAKKLTEELYEKVTELGKSSLAQYICNRKVILEILKKSLEADENGKFQKEEAIHKLIFPLGKTSEELPYEKQNLWILDERLAYHNYLASDIALKKMTPLETGDRKEPDITIFKGPMALSDSNAPFDSVVIVEFKRPERSDYSSSENPISQVLNYISKIRSAKAKDRTGRTFDVSPTTRFYGFIVCDSNSKLAEIAEHYNFKPTPEHGGYFLFHEKYNAYLEIATYNKVLNDAMKRNKILFDHLKLE